MATNNSKNLDSDRDIGSNHVTSILTSSKPGMGTFDVVTLVRNQFPLAVPRYEIRRDISTNEEVHRGRTGRAALHGGMWTASLHGGHHKRMSKSDRVSFIDMSTDYQCAPNEPDFDDANGGISMMRMAPPTMRSVEWVSAYAETRCPHSGHDSCQGRVDEFKKGNYPEKFGVYGNNFNPFEQVYNTDLSRSNSSSLQNTRIMTPVMILF
jgi:hypothetical protein